MRSDADCPSASLLEQLMLGQLSDHEAEPLERHLADCGRCGSLASSIQAGGVLVEAMRAPSPILQETANPVVERLIGHLRGLRPGDTPALLSPDPTPASPSPVEDNLLEPAREPGEIGRLGPYRVVKVLGSGGMGVVYQAWQAHPRRLVALKLGQARRWRARLHQEPDIVGRLQHPHIVPVYEAGEYHGLPYFTMELLDGGSLAQQLATALLAPRAAAELVESLAQAVQFAHERGIVHRDLKPSNVLLTRDGVAKIGDFGLAKLVEPDLEHVQPGCRTETGALLGTPGYMAPEQAAGHSKEIGPAADVYALGAILYECLTGRPPFRAATVLETLDQVRNQEPVPPGRLQPGVPRDLQTICLKCLEKAPARRYISAQELADDLGRFLRGEPIRARPAGLAERLAKWARRRPALAALVGICVLALAGFVTGAAVHEQLLRNALQETTAERERANTNYREARNSATNPGTIQDPRQQRCAQAARAAAPAAGGRSGVFPEDGRETG
jgi:predicted Ser/Thr protein kinase